MSETQKENGSFTTGFMLGIAAGAFGYFAFGTKRGEELRKRLQQEWLDAREQLRAESGNTAGEVKDSVFSHVKQFIENSLSSLEVIRKPESDSDKSATAKKRKHKKRALFKGV